MSDAPRFPHEKALAIARALDRGHIAHAFGGAIALAFAAEPRATVDVDVNLFVPVTRADEVLSTLNDLGIPVHEPGLRERLGQPIRVLSPEDLAVFKVLFDRAKDWVDLEAIVLTRGDRFEAGYVERWVSEIAGADDPRSAKLRTPLRKHAARVG